MWALDKPLLWLRVVGFEVYLGIGVEASVVVASFENYLRFLHVWVRSIVLSWFRWSYFRIKSKDGPIFNM